MGCGYRSYEIPRPQSQVSMVRALVVISFVPCTCVCVNYRVYTDHIIHKGNSN